MSHNDLSELRELMVEKQIIARGIKDTRVVAAMGKVPRHRFVPDQAASDAYADHPLPIGYGQTISQPYIVALMTESLALQGNEKVLEIGMGSGYQAAVLAEVASVVFTVERIPILAAEGWERLNALGYSNIHYKVADGTLGWPENQPYDAILVTAGAPSVPDPLKEQLALGGRMIIPVGDRQVQELMKIERTAQGFTETRLGGCQFVALVGARGWD